MPKKSKRRAKTRGGGGGGKAREGGGQKGIVGDGATAKNSADANNWDDDDDDDDDGAGILTAGAIQMLMDKKTGAAGSGPIRLQVFESKKCAIQQGYVLRINDGVHHYSAVLYDRSVNPATDMDRNAIIVVNRWAISEGVAFQDGKQLGTKILAFESITVSCRNFGRIVGNPSDFLQIHDGILTAGASRMIAEIGEGGWQSFPPLEHAPVLQIAGIHDDPGKGEYSITLSDGEYYILSTLPAWLPDAQLVASRQVTVHSIVRVKHHSSISKCRVKLNGESVETYVVSLSGMEIIKGNVSNIIGYPTTVRSTHASSSSGRPIVSPHLSVKSVGHSDAPAENTDDSACPSSYSVRLELARDVLALSGNAASKGNLKSIAKQCCDALNLPRELTEGFRSIFIMDYCAYADQICSDLVSDTDICSTHAVETYLDCVEGHTRFFKSIASDMSESIDTRAMALYACCLPSVMFPCTTSNHMNYLRRFVDMSKQVSLHDLPAPFEVAIDKSGIRIDSVKVFLDMLKMANFRLKEFGGLATPEISDLLYTNPRTAHFCRTFGGLCCDNCGETPDDAGMNHLFKCNSCRLAWYCSESCQAECWSKGHRDCCKKFGSFQDGDILVLFGLMKKFELNLSIVQLLGSDVNGRLKVMIVVPGTQGLRRVMGTVSDGMVKKKTIGYQSQTRYMYSMGTIISVKKENLRHCRPLK